MGNSQGETRHQDQLYLHPAARTQKLLLINAVKVINRRVEELRSRGRVAVVGGVADPLDTGDWKVGASGWNPVGAAVCGEISGEKNLKES